MGTYSRMISQTNLLLVIKESYGIPWRLYTMGQNPSYLKSGYGVRPLIKLAYTEKTANQ